MCGSNKEIKNKLAPAQGCRKSTIVQQDGLITGKERGAIQRCAAQADIPRGESGATDDVGEDFQATGRLKSVLLEVEMLFMR